MDNTNQISAKLLLFGEYAIVRDGQGLALPLNIYSGQWQYANSKEERKLKQYDLPDFITKIESLAAEGQLLFELDIDRLWDEAEKGIFFNSTIPMGYGLGSSGALCAAIYQRFAKSLITDTNKESVIALKKILAQLEGFFHGTSSGLDPLVCYLQKPVLVDGEELEIIDRSLPFEKEPYHFFLLDTHQKRETEPLVDLFLEKVKNADFSGRLDSELVLENEEAIHAFCNGQWKITFEAMHEISFFQYRYFIEMIPDTIKNVWLNGLESKAFKLKLCGAGGGGFMLGLSRDRVQTERALVGYELTFL